MRYRNIASPRTMINIGYPVFFVLAFILIVLIISGKFFWLAIILPIAAISLFVLMSPKKYRNALCMFEMNEEGISNRQVSFRWEEIEQISIAIEELPRHGGARGLLPKSDETFRIYFVCIGSQKTEYLSNLSPKEVVFFSLSKQNVRMLQKFGSGKSAKIDAFLNEHRDMLE